MMQAIRKDVIATGFSISEGHRTITEVVEPSTLKLAGSFPSPKPAGIATVFKDIASEDTPMTNNLGYFGGCGRQRHAGKAGDEPRILSHTTMEICGVLVRNANKLGKSSTQTKSQKKAMLRLKRFSQKYELGRRKPDDGDLLEEWFYLFDRLFFFNGLHKYTKLCIRSSEDVPGRLGLTNSHKEDMYFDYATGTPWARVTIVSIESSRSRSMQLVQYLETLVHKLLHAFFSTYTCVCICETSGCSDTSSCCFDEVYKYEGRTSHGIAWLTARKAIQDNMQVLNIRSDKIADLVEWTEIEGGFAIEFVNRAETYHPQYLKLKYGFPEGEEPLRNEIRCWGPAITNFTEMNKEEIEKLGIDLDELAEEVINRYYGVS